jgi:REP element-mobilizing transposase RayT
MIHAYHATFGTYGSWLPNDPRGSASTFVGGEKLHNIGGRADRNKRTSYEHLDAHEQRRQELLQTQLARQQVTLNESQMNAIASAFAQFVTENYLQVWAAEILPCHVHMVFARCNRKSESVIDKLKQHTHKRIITRGIQPVGCTLEKSIWADGRWIVYLDKEQSIESAIAYVVNNPIEEGRLMQNWPFVVPFRGIESNIVAYRD